MDYGKKHTIETFDKGVLTNTKQAFEIPVLSNRSKLVGDIVEALVPITSGATNKVELEIIKDVAGNWRIKKKWTTK